jgi:hypothetical protein
VQQEGRGSLLCNIVQQEDRYAMDRPGFQSKPPESLVRCCTILSKLTSHQK